MYMFDVQMVDWALSKMVSVDTTAAPMHHNVLLAAALPLIM